MYSEIVLLGILSSIILLMAILERVLHLRNLKKIRIRVHVNGTRGKSTVTRLIAAGLRESGLKVIAKTTGTEARFIFEDGSEEPIVRKKKPNISEQLGIVKKAAKRGADALVIECMALYPENQWVAERMMINSTIGVITNVFADHLDVMGPTVDDVAKALSMTVPKKAVLVTDPGEYVELFRTAAKKLKTEVYVGDESSVSDEENSRFEYVSFKQNVATALEACRLAGVDREVALRGMIKAAGDPGVMRILKLDNILFAGAFAANDATSTISAWKRFSEVEQFNNTKQVVLINNRADRIQRMGEIVDTVVEHIRPDYTVLIGDSGFLAKKHMKKAYKSQNMDYGEAKVIDLTSVKTPEEIVKRISDVFGKGTQISLLGVGNAKVIGEQIMQYFESNGERVS